MKLERSCKNVVKKFLENTTRTSTKPSVAFTPQKPNKIQSMVNEIQRQGITPNLTNIRLNNKAVPLNPTFKGKPRSGNFGTKRLVGF